jgi:hypothetical protein
MIKQPMILVAKMLELVKRLQETMAIVKLELVEKIQVIVVEIMLKSMELLEMVNCRIVESMEK